MDLGGASWIVTNIMFVVALAAALTYAIFKWHLIKDDRRPSEARDRAAHRNYKQGG